jgi:dethiobiotin synthetase
VTGVAALRGPVLVTGTDTGVGKTIVTAAIAAAATVAGLRVAVLKPGQTGIAPGSPELSDIEVITRLAGPARAVTLATYPDPLAPATAARVSGLAPLELAEVVGAVRELDAGHDLVLIEGAGGLLVHLGPGWTAADLATAVGAPAVVVVRAGLGTLNHTALTLEALQRRDIGAYVVIGSWPAEVEPVHRLNLEDLPGVRVGMVPAGAAELTPETFRAAAPGWLSPVLHGTRIFAGDGCDASDLRMGRT